MRPIKPNILFIFSDQHAHDMMSCTGKTEVSTPNMDRIAQAGTRFSRTYCTNPLCVPSRFSLMTGRMPSSVKVRGNQEGSTDVTDAIKQQGLGWKLRQQGYHAAYAGKVHLPGIKTEELGFEFLCEGDERKQLVDQCCQFLARKHDKPFFLTASLINPHDICYMVCKSFESEEELLKKYDRNPSGPAMKVLDKVFAEMKGFDRDSFIEKNCPPLPENFEIPLGEPEAIGNMLKKQILRGRAREEWTDNDFRLYRWVYARLTEVVDEEIGQILKVLDEHGLTDNTVIIYSSDHGDMNAAHRMEQKTVFYEESARVPLILSWPGVIPEGRVIDTLVSNGLDMYPTICDIVGADISEGLLGQSLLPLAAGKGSIPKRSYLPIENILGNCVVSATHKYECYFEGENSEQLRDLQRDAGEMQNFISDPGYQGVLNEMKRVYREFFGKAG